MDNTGRVRKFVVWIALSAFVLLFASFLTQYPGHGSEIDFDWNEANGFALAHVNRPTPSALLKPLAAAFDWLIVLQTRPRIASLFRQWGWNQARGHIPVTTIWPLPLVLKLSEMGNVKIIDPTVTPLIEAARRQDLERVKDLLASGANVDAKDQNGATALIYAKGNLIGTLVSAGADVNVNDRLGRSPLYDAACLAIDPDATAQLIAAGARVNVTYDKTIFLDHMATPLMCALDQRSEAEALRVVVPLLSAGADASTRNPQGKTALLIAEERRYSRVAQLLMQASRTE